MSVQPIAVFDSGLGGLSVVKHLRRLLPHEDIVYFGDTARVPYGTKSQPTVVHFALENARFLMRFDPKLIAVACNTASSLALHEIKEAVPVPVVGVVEPGARAAAAVARGRAVAVLGTEATVASKAYNAALSRIAPDLSVVGVPCPLFVPLVEEGRGCDDPLVRGAVESYLKPLADRKIGAALLACTHYPLLRDAISRFLGAGIEVVDAGRASAQQVRQVLSDAECLSDGTRTASMDFYVSDNPTRFRSVGSRFLEESIEHVEFVAPESYVSSAVLQSDTQ